MAVDVDLKVIVRNSAKGRLAWIRKIRLARVFVSKDQAHIAVLGFQWGEGRRHHWLLNVSWIGPHAWTGLPHNNSIDINVLWFIHARIFRWGRVGLDNL